MNTSFEYLTKITYLDDEYIKKFISEINIIETIKKDNSKIPYQWHKAIDLLSNLVADSQITKLLCGTSIPLNIAILKPSYFFHYTKDVINVLSKLEKYELFFLLSKKEFTVQLINNILSSEVSLPSSFALQSIVSYCSHHNLDHNHEINLIEEIMTRLEDDNNSFLVLSAFKQRISKITFKETTNDTSFENEHAILICGQLRGYAEPLKNLNNLLSNKNNVDIYISTWSDVGYPSLSKERISRIFSPEALIWIERNVSPDYISEKINKASEYFTAHLNQSELESNLKKILTNARAIKVNIKNDKEYPYNRMFRAEKMYYHNAYWIETLGKKHFSKYKSILKIRPDLLLGNIDFNVNDNTVLVESYNGWIFRDWGFGMGDQIIQGSPMVMNEIMTVHSHNEVLHELKCILSISQDKFSGHANCGLSAWLNGLKASKSNIEIKGFSQFELLDLNVAKLIFG